MNTSQFVRRFNAVVSFSVVAIVATAFSLVPAFAETDPFPGVATGSEIPGTRISSAPGLTQSQWEATDTYKAFSCPVGAGNGIGVDLNFTTTNSDDTQFAYCVKTWQAQSVVDARAAYNQQVSDAQAVALSQSTAWNAAHPGEQKCFQWGPFTDPNGGTSSGGVCANPVAAPTSSSSESETSTPLVSPTPTPSETSTPVVVSTPTPTPTPTASAAPVNGLAGVGGWAVIDSAGKVYGVVVCDNAVCGTRGSWGGVMPVEYMGCPIGCRLVLQTSADPQTGNVAGWRSQEGTDVIYNSSSNTFSVQQTNQSQPSLIITPPSANSYSFATPINQPVATSANDTSTASVETVTVTTGIVPSAGVSDSSTASTPNAPTPVVSLEPMSADVIPFESDGEEIDSPPAADISVKKESTGKYLISLDSNIYEDTLLVRAFKKGSKIVIYKVTTNINGLAAIRTSRNLSGFKLAVYIGNDFLDSIKLP
jgi:hypothetical protein